MSVGPPTPAGAPSAAAVTPGDRVTHPAAHGDARPIDHPALAGRQAPAPLGPGALALLLVLAALVAGGTLLVSEQSEGSALPVGWPAAGLAAWLTVRARPGWTQVVVPVLLALAVGIAHAALSGTPLVASVVLGGTDAVAATVVALSLRGVGRRTSWRGLDGTRDLARLLAACLAGSLAFGGGIAALTLAFSASGEGPTPAGLLRLGGAAVIAWLASSVVALAAVGSPSPAPGEGARGGETAVQVVLACLAFGFAFSPGQQLALAVAPLPLLAWAALRLGARVTAFEVLLVGIGVTLATQQGWGPYADTDGDPVLLSVLVQAYVVCVVLLTLPPALLLHQRRRLSSALVREQALFTRHFTDSVFGNLLAEEDDAGTVRVTRANDAALAALGRSRASILGQPLGALVDESARTRLAHATGRAETWRGRTGVPGRPGARLELGLTPLTAPGEQPATWSVQLLDLTDQEAARRRAEDAERLTESTLATTAAMIVVCDPDGRVRLVNDATTRVTGWPAADLLGRPVWETGLVPGARGDLETLATWPNRSGAPVVRERHARTAAGDTLRVRWSDNAVRDADGQAALLVLTGIDVTQERAASSLVDHLLRAPVGTGILGLDEHGVVTVANAGAEILLGRAVDALVGTPVADLLERVDALGEAPAEPGDRNAEALTTLAAPDGDLAEPTDWRVRLPGGGSVTLSVTLSRVDEPAARSRYLLVARDVTAERQVVEQLKALDGAKSDFVMTVSHELRTPTTSILGYAQFLADEPLAPEQLKMVDAVLRNAKRLAAMNEDLLFLARMDAGIVEGRERHRVDLARVAEEACERHADAAALRGLSLSCTAERGAEVLGDEVLLRRMTDNLLGNAVKFTEAGGEVHLTVTGTAAEVRLEVRDTGLGIPAEEQEGLFQRFYRSSTAVDRAVQGPGLGLSIVAAVVAAHAGTVSVRSEHLQGATFTVVLPGAAPEPGHGPGRHTALPVGEG
ncbi:ATP-binding protein [Nocardioides sp. GY 10127]|uniref:ATP-binding protein n=1 Tax=Nocardioides sp. GY 10127 TaxID=2569762 RepID=UPI0010A84440|nr:ATP-binding protein [Nocardioides sp. GY 10127]TIC83966.1 PAS domain S-box protein [Nocardioides sp. GY 10127]